MGPAHLAVPVHRPTRPVGGATGAEPRGSAGGGLGSSQPVAEPSRSALRLAEQLRAALAPVEKTSPDSAIPVVRRTSTGGQTTPVVGQARSRRAGPGLVPQVHAVQPGDLERPPTVPGWAAPGCLASAGHGRPERRSDATGRRGGEILTGDESVDSPRSKVRSVMVIGSSVADVPLPPWCRPWPMSRPTDQ